jgi:predicted metal-dependent peptidase
MMLHMGMGHHLIPEGVDERAWNLACDLVIEGLMKSVLLHPPTQYRIPDNMRISGRPQATREYCERLAREVDLKEYGQGDIVRGGKYDLQFQQQQKQRTEQLAQGIRRAAADAIDDVSGKTWRDEQQGYKTRSQLVVAWFLANYPLLSPFMAGVKIVEDKQECDRLDIRVAAVRPSKNIIYVNPMAPLSEEELKFVIAHEVLHIALLHEQRAGVRDHYLWNVSCDYVINRWLVQLGLGKMPTIGLLYDPKFDGMSADEIYDILKTDLRRARRLVSLRGKGLGDMFYDPDYWDRSDGVSREEWVRMQLARGLDLHRTRSRGFLPGDMEQEIESLSQPPIPWDAQLAQWFQSHFPPRMPARSYARASRRQGSTPDIPRLM